MNETSDRIREKKLKAIGNSALILCGIWWQYIEHANTYGHGADRGYHEQMGVRAYRLIEKELYLELAENFSELTVVLARIGGTLAIGDDDRQILRLYEYALRTQNKIALKLLRARGILLEPDSGMEH